MRSNETELWRFETANLAVVLTAEPEEMDPADSFEFQEDINAVRRGEVEWFSAKVAVHLLDDGGALNGELGADYLGGCSYYRYEDFYTGHRDPDPMARNCTIMRAARGQNVVMCNYFTDMVRQAVNAARTELRRMKAIRVRGELEVV